METRHPQLARFLRQYAFREGGQFKLASGKMSPYYVDGKWATYHPQGIALVADAILEEVRDLEFDAMGGMELGATAIAPPVVLRGRQTGRDFHGFTVRKAAKEHGTRKRIEGPLEKGDRVVVVEDVVTSGKSLLEAVDAIREWGCTVVCAVSIVDREEGGAQLLAERGIDYRPLVTMTDLRAAGVVAGH